MEANKTWTMRVLVIFMVCLLVIAGFNFVMDPFWTFGHKHQFNKIQIGFNDRLMKTNKITFQPFTYDTLLVGNSRTTYVDQSEFNQLDVYNYAVNGLGLSKCLEVIRYAKKIKKDEFDTIILGLDYFQTRWDNDSQGIDEYIHRTEDPLYRLKSVVSLDMSKQSLDNLQASYFTKRLYGYTPDNRRNSMDVSLETHETQIQRSLNIIKNRLKNETYKYNESYLDIIKQIKQDNPNTTFIIYTPPIASPLIQEIVIAGKLPYYK
jgi:hypothetical protein